MADRYWVGGTASWDGTAGTKWSTTSGGAGGASVPTSADDVFFSALSTGTCTIATGNTGAKSIDCTGFTGTLAGAANISIAGSLTLVAGMTYSYSGFISFTATATLTTAGKTLGAVGFDAVGGTLTLGSAFFNSGSNFTVTNGTFTTNNYSFTSSNLSVSVFNAPTVNLGSSTISVSGTFDCGNGTINAGTSQINLTGSSGALANTGSKTFYNVSFTSTAADDFGSVNVRRITGTGTSTFNNLVLTAASTGAAFLRLSGNLTINGTFTATSGSSGPFSRSLVMSDTIGTTRTITAAAISASDCDFRDITLAGAAAGASPTRAGNCGGNSGITFPAAKTVYRVGTETSWQGSSSWATSSGGAGSNNNFPLAQDTAIFDNSATPSSTFQIDWGWNIGTLNCTSRTNAITLNFSSYVSFYGSFILGSGVTISGSNAQVFSPRSTVDFTSAGKTISFSVTVDAPSGTVRLGDAFSSEGTVLLTRGTLNANNYNFAALALSSSNSNTRTITMGSGLWTLSGTSPWTTNATTGLTFNKDTANILLSNTTTTSRFFNGGGLAFNKLTIGGATGTSTTSISGANSFTELASTKTVAHTISFSANQGTIGTWTIAGTSGNVVTVNSGTAGTRRTFTLTNITGSINYLSVKDIGELNGNKFYVGANSTDGGNNSNVYFTASPTASTGSMLMLF
jgi:hypothetical protein